MSDLTDHQFLSDHQGRTHVLAGQAHDQHDGVSATDGVSDDHEWSSPVHVTECQVRECQLILVV